MSDTDRKPIADIVPCPEGTGKKIVFISPQAKAAFQKLMGVPVDPDQEYFVGKPS